MSEILSGLPGVLNLIDDVLVFGKGQAKQDSVLHETLEQLEKAGVNLNKAKCVLSTNTVTFLGCVICRHGIRPDP